MALGGLQPRLISTGQTVGSVFCSMLCASQHATSRKMFEKGYKNLVIHQPQQQARCVVTWGLQFAAWN